MCDDKRNQAIAGWQVGLKKRSFSLSGHRTSVALEDEFWSVLDAEAKNTGRSLAGLIKSIDETRDGRALASALRIHALAVSRTSI
jgi:predicted DNA-binding ribbon-helix-helix protein